MEIRKRDKLEKFVKIVQTNAIGLVKMFSRFTKTRFDCSTKN